jgi:hypothetical protein
MRFCASIARQWKMTGRTPWITRWWAWEVKIPRHMKPRVSAPKTRVQDIKLVQQTILTLQCLQNLQETTELDRKSKKKLMYHSLTTHSLAKDSNWISRHFQSRISWIADNKNRWRRSKRVNRITRMGRNTWITTKLWTKFVLKCLSILRRTTTMNFRAWTSSPVWLKNSSINLTIQERLRTLNLIHKMQLTKNLSSQKLKIKMKNIHLMQ